MKIGIPKEIRPGERRVAATPDTVSRLLKLGFEVSVETQAGAGASFRDAEYSALGATVLLRARELWDTSDLILKVQPPEQNTELGLHEAEAARGRHPGQFHLAREERRARRSVGCAPRHGAGPWIRCRASPARKRWTP